MKMNQAHQQSEARKLEEEELPPTPEVDTNSELAEKVDALLDEIDSVLEENAEEFIQAYVQLGGQ